MTAESSSIVFMADCRGYLCTIGHKIRHDISTAKLFPSQRAVWSALHVNVQWETVIFLLKNERGWPELKTVIQKTQNLNVVR